MSDCTANRHGTYSAYVAGCRCPDARAAAAAYQRKREKLAYLGIPLRVPAAGSVRRLRALHAIGWDFRTIATHGVSNEKYVEHLARAGTTPSGLIFASTAGRIAAVYERLSMTPGPSLRARLRAQRRGWPPPLAWDDDTIDDPAAEPDLGGDETVIDDVAIERCLAGVPVPLTRAERLEAARRGLERGIGSTALQRLLGLNGTTLSALRREVAA